MIQHAAAILSGGNREAVIPELIEGLLPLVDHIVFVDSGESAQKAITIGVDMVGAGKSTVVKYDCGDDFDCATARNIGLDSARDIGAQWVSIWDTDERPLVTRAHLDDVLSTTDAHIIMAADKGNTYKKTKLFRVPAAGRWDGIVHEAYVSCGEKCLIDKEFRFWELPRTAEESAERMRMIERKCRIAIEREPGNARWHYYLGDSLSANDKLDEAVEEFTKAALLSAWHEEIDWSYYRAAVAREGQGRRQDAINLCKTAGLRIPEHAWFAAYAAHRDGQHEAAVYFALEAIELAAKQRGVERVGFCYRHAWYEGPHDVARWAYRALGKEAKAKEQDELVKTMQEMRLRDTESMS